MEILKGIEIIDKALWFRKQKVLIIADLHIGYEEALNKQGLLLPRTMFKELIAEIKILFKKIKVKPKLVIINGDLKHEFGEISRQEWNETLEILDFLLKKAKVILIKGNHDTILGPIARQKGLSVRDFYCFDEVCILHGHKIIEDKEVSKAKLLIIGHQHPAFALREGAKKEMYKCFLLGRWKRKKLIVIPSMLPFVEGSEIKGERYLSPYLGKSVGSFEVFALGDKVYKFGRLEG